MYDYFNSTLIIIYYDYLNTYLLFESNVADFNPTPICFQIDNNDN